MDAENDAPVRYTQPFTPSGAWRVEAYVGISQVMVEDEVALVVWDSTADESGNGFRVAMSGNGQATFPPMKFLASNSGSYSQVGSTAYAPMARRMWFALEGDGEGNTSAYFSTDRNQWILMGTSTVACTVAKAGVRFARNSTGGPGSVEIFDVVPPVG